MHDAGAPRKGRCNHCKANCCSDEDNWCSFLLREHPHEVCDQCRDAGYTDCVPGLLKEDYMPLARRIKVKVEEREDRPTLPIRMLAYPSSHTNITDNSGQQASTRPLSPLSSIRASVTPSPLQPLPTTEYEEQGECKLLKLLI